MSAEALRIRIDSLVEDSLHMLAEATAKTARKIGTVAVGVFAAMAANTCGADLPVIEVPKAEVSIADAHVPGLGYESNDPINPVVCVDDDGKGNLDGIKRGRVSFVTSDPTIVTIDKVNSYLDQPDFENADYTLPVPMNSTGTGIYDLPDSKYLWSATSPDTGVYEYIPHAFESNCERDAAASVQITPNPYIIENSGYRMVAGDGGVLTYGNAGFYGSAAGKSAHPIVGGDTTSSGKGYTVVDAAGDTYAFGDAPNTGSLPNSLKSGAPIVDIENIKNNQGSYLVASDGMVYAIGNAVYKGSMGGNKLNQPIVGMSETPTGEGYWLVAADGGIFAYGDAKFFGSTGGIKLNQPIVGMASTESGEGYWLVAADGGIFAYGDAKFHGSTGGIRLNSQVKGMLPTMEDNGYYLVAGDGGIFAFGNAKFQGSAGSVKLHSPVVGIMRGNATETTSPKTAQNEPIPIKNQHLANNYKPSGKDAPRVRVKAA